MQKSVQIAGKVAKDLEKNWLPELEVNNLHSIFSPIFSLNVSIITGNIIVAFIILAYDNDSSWLNLKQDRKDNKRKILKSLTEDWDSDFFETMLNNENSEINDVIGSYLENQSTWKFRTIMTLLDYHSNMMRFVNQKTEAEKKIDKMNKDGNKVELSQDYDIDVITKVNKQKGELLEQAIQAREKADRLISELNKEFVQLNHAVQQDFGFELTEEKKISPESWRDFIRYKVIPERQRKTN